MTDPRGVHSAHLDAATIAALVDRTLDPAARAAAEAHLAGCADCREVWMDTSDIASDTEVGGWAAAPAAADAPGSRGRSRRWIYGGAGLAIAAALALVVFSPRMFDRGDRPELRELVEAVGTNRRTEARLTGGFQWGPVPSVTRGDDASSLPAKVQLAAITLRDAARAGRDARSLAAAGSGALIVGDADAAVEALSESVRLVPDANVFSDLAGALLERARTRQDNADATAAVDAADRALSLHPDLPEALFNRALALEYLSRTEAARAAWRAYVAVERDVNWAGEGQRRIGATR